MTTTAEFIEDVAQVTLKSQTGAYGDYVISSVTYSQGGLIAPVPEVTPEHALTLTSKANLLLDNAFGPGKYGWAPDSKRPTGDELKDLTRKALNAAADLLDKDGWVQGIGRSSAGEHCAMGAIDEVVCVGAYHPVVHSAAQQALSRLLFHIGYSGNVIDYNDTPGRRAEEVSNVIRKAAEHCDVSDFTGDIGIF